MPSPPEQLRQAQPPQQRRHLARVMERAGGAGVVAERHQHALGAPVRSAGRGRGVGSRAPRTLPARDCWRGGASGCPPRRTRRRPPWPRRSASRPAVFKPPGERRERGQHDFADGALPRGDAAGTRRAACSGRSLPHQDDAPDAVPRLADLLVVGQPWESRLLHQHVLAGGQRPKGELEVEPGRHGDDDGVDARVVDRVPVVPVASRTPRYRARKASALPRSRLA